MSNTAVLSEIKKLLKGYLGNKNLKRAGEVIEFTAENVQEWLKCKNDPIYFINNYCKIISLDDGLIKFNTFPYQNRSILSMHENRKTIHMFGRQCGKTTTVSAYILHYILFSDGVPSVAILAHKASGAREVMQRLQLMYEYLPKWMQKGVKTWNKGNIILEGEDGADGAQVFTGATTSSGIRGKTVSLLYIDECAIIPNTVAEEFFTATYPTISSGAKTKIIITSTPKGYNHFWHYWSKADPSLKDWNGFLQCRAEWNEHPKHDEKWYNDQLAMLGQLKFNQEVLMHFLGSSATLIEPGTISKLFSKSYIYEKDGLDVLVRPIKGHSYVMIVDPSKGSGGDYHAASIIDITTLPYVQVAKYRDNVVSPMLLPNILARIATEYNEAFILLENNVSEQIGYILYHEVNYENILMVSRDKRGQFISNGFADVAMGVTMDKKIKSTGCNNLKILIEENKLLIHDEDTIKEISTFIDNGKGTYAADDGYKDDLIMTLVMFGWLTTQNYFKDLSDIDLRSRIYRERMEAIENEMLPVGFVTDGNETDDDYAFLELLR